MSSNISLIRVHASWCGPCKIFAPVIEKVAKELEISVKSVDVSNDDAFIEDNDIKGIPTLIVVDDATGEEISRTAGAMSESELKSYLNARC